MDQYWDMHAGTGEKNDRDGEMTLAFDLGAIEALANPGDAVSDARRWSRYVGVVSNDQPAVETFVRRHGIRQDFELGSLDRQSVLSKLKWEADTARYVLVGTTERDRDLAEHVGWEYVPVEEAAAAADWTLAAETGPLAGIRARLVGLSPWSR